MHFMFRYRKIVATGHHATNSKWLKMLVIKFHRRCSGIPGIRDLNLEISSKIDKFRQYKCTWCSGIDKLWPPATSLRTLNDSKWMELLQAAHIYFQFVIVTTFPVLIRTIQESHYQISSNIQWINGWITLSSSIHVPVSINCCHRPRR